MLKTPKSTVFQKQRIATECLSEISDARASAASAAVESDKRVLHIDSNLRHCESTSRSRSRLGVQKKYHMHTAHTHDLAQMFKELKSCLHYDRRKGTS